VIVAATTTETTLRILAEWDQNLLPDRHPDQRKTLDALPVAGHDWHPDCTYDLRPPGLNRTKRK